DKQDRLQTAQRSESCKCGLIYYKRRRVPPRNTITQTAGRNHPALYKMESFTALRTNSCRETARDRLLLPSVFPVTSLFPQPFLE
ncbi:unnamed protein product, partial [Bubo scandiacus]